ncbi:hypothetical protein RRG08_046910 [Elysia crispata]|uniref:Uncharacterized protein n=1 Tax=Elysia crispata TaxID=231223 RepID=A0AAE0ZIC5_9GAST|nr:hypothetical protein RRG08_046910 [Elysia crispata]
MKPDSVIKVDLEEEALHPYTHHLKFISVTRGPGRSCFLILYWQLYLEDKSIIPVAAQNDNQTDDDKRQKAAVPWHVNETGNCTK